MQKLKDTCKPPNNITNYQRFLNCMFDGKHPKNEESWPLPEDHIPPAWFVKPDNIVELLRNPSGRDSRDCKIVDADTTVATASGIGQIPTGKG